MKRCPSTLHAVDYTENVHEKMPETTVQACHSESNVDAPKDGYSKQSRQEASRCWRRGRLRRRPIIHQKARIVQESRHHLSKTTLSLSLAHNSHLLPQQRRIHFELQLIRRRQPFATHLRQINRIAVQVFVADAVLDAVDLRGCVGHYEGVVVERGVVEVDFEVNRDPRIEGAERVEDVEVREVEFDDAGGDGAGGFGLGVVGPGCAEAGFAYFLVGAGVEGGREGL